MRRLLVLALPVTLFGALAACGSDGDGGATGTGTGQVGEATTTTVGTASTPTTASTPSTPSTAPTSSTAGGPTTTLADTGGSASVPARGPAFVERVVTTVGADRAVTVDIAGQVPTPCHRPGWQTGPTGADRRLGIDVYSVPPKPDELCAQVLTPFSDQVRLGPLDPGTYVVVVNGTDHPVTVP